MATRKTNREKDVVSSSASAAPVRSRRAGTTARPQHSLPAAETTVTSQSVPESAAAGYERSAHADTVAVKRELVHEEIARLAYALWQSRGCQDGNPEEDWLRAEQQLRETGLSAAR